ncbi:uncharacterized protein [Bemisia tabaci]|uniref:uncharacterized protein n=1 Tax=Bemisia tabaci TaxID=7038 RepID=UPI003B27C977
MTTNPRRNHSYSKVTRVAGRRDEGAPMKFDPRFLQLSNVAHPSNRLMKAIVCVPRSPMDLNTFLKAENFNCNRHKKVFGIFALLERDGGSDFFHLVSGPN